MKLFPKIVLLTFVTAFTTSVQAEPSKYTAKHVRGNGGELVGKDVSIDITHVTPIKKASTDEYAVLMASTWDERENLSGGTIAILVHASELDATVKKYGAAPDKESAGRRRDFDTRRLSGVLAEIGKAQFYVIDASDGKVDLSTVKKPEDDAKGKGDGKGDGKGKGKGQAKKKPAGN